MKLRQLVCITCFLIFNSNGKAQSEIIFENVSQAINIFKPNKDSAYAFNFEYLSAKQVAQLSYNLKGILNYENTMNGPWVFSDEDKTSPYNRNDLRKILIRQKDSVDVERFDNQGNAFIEHVGLPADSTWFFDNIAGLKFKEDWVIDTARFTCDIKSRSYTPLVYLPGKEDLGPMAFLTIKPAGEQKIFEPVTDFIITDVFVKNDPTEDQPIVMESNTEIDSYKLLLLINTVIDKAKMAKIKCFKPIIPFKTQMTTAELKAQFKEEIAPNKNDHFQVRYKLYCYRFKMVEKWSFDRTALAFKKEALGMVLMKRKGINRNNKELSYTFSPVAYIPFNRK